MILFNLRLRALCWGCLGVTLQFASSHCSGRRQMPIFDCLRKRLWMKARMTAREPSFFGRESNVTEIFAMGFKCPWCFGRQSQHFFVVLFVVRKCDLMLLLPTFCNLSGLFFNPDKGVFHLKNQRSELANLLTLSVLVLVVPPGAYIVLINMCNCFQMSIVDNFKIHSLTLKPSNTLKL